MYRIANRPMLNTVASHSISVYQRYISPYKGFRCAYRVATGRCSCSDYAKKIVQRLGVGALRVAMPRQFARCRLAYASLQHNQNGRGRENKSRRKEGNRCDCSGLDCGGCNDLDICGFFHDSHGAPSLCETPLSGCDAAPCDCSF